MLERFTQHVPFRGARAPLLSVGLGIVRRGSSLASRLQQSARNKVPRGPDCVPPAGDGVGAQIESINGVKAKSIVVLSAFLLQVRSGFQLCLVPNWEACVTCLCPFSKKRRLDKGPGFAVFFRCRLSGKGNDSFEIYKRIVVYTITCQNDRFEMWHLNF